jgi:hypothetical protein
MRQLQPVTKITYLRPNIVEDLHQPLEDIEDVRKLLNDAANEIEELRKFIDKNGQAWARFMGEMTKEVWNNPS